MNISSPLSLFLLASLAIHTAVAMISNKTGSIALPTSEGSAMAVKINKSAPIVKTQKQIKKTDITKTKHAIKTTTSASPTKTPEVLKEVVQKKQNKTLPLSSDKMAMQSKAHVISALNNELRQYFIYPRLAQKRNWQGKVLVSVQIRANGDIKNIQISQSSGYSVLDNAAIDSMRKIKKLSGISSWLANDVFLNIPVIYQLTQS